MLKSHRIVNILAPKLIRDKLCLVILYSEQCCGVQQILISKERCINSLFLMHIHSMEKNNCKDAQIYRTWNNDVCCLTMLTGRHAPMEIKGLINGMYCFFPGDREGGWSAWSAFTQCTEPRYCYKGNQTRTRKCDNPPRLGNGDDCRGLTVETQECPTPAENCAGIVSVSIQMFKSKVFTGVEVLCPFYPFLRSFSATSFPSFFPFLLILILPSCLLSLFPPFFPFLPPTFPVVFPPPPSFFPYFDPSFLSSFLPSFSLHYFFPAFLS